MRYSVPGLPGVYYNTSAESTAINLALTAAGRRAPKPQGYAIQLLPYLWGLEVELRELPPEHPLQYLHPEGARSMQAIAPDRNTERMIGDMDLAVRTAWALNEETQRGFERLFGQREELPALEDGIVIEVESGEPLESKAHDSDDSPARTE